MKKFMQKSLLVLVRSFLLLTAFCLSPAINVHAADTEIHSIDVHVTLNDDGSADITETWDITMTSGTEWYLVQGNLGKIEIQDFSVSDETGLVYEYLDRWNVNRSLEEKAGKCGIVYQGDGVYELCFGIGSYGRHQFNVSYRMTNFIKGFNDYCGFNQRFINDDLSSWVDHMSVTIEKPGTAFTSEDVKVWAFGFTGNIHVIDGVVYAESESSLSSSNYVNIMCRFPREMFDTTNIVKKSFDTMMKKAMKGSDYSDVSLSFSDNPLLLAFPLLLMGFSIICVFAVPIALIVSHRQAKRNIPTTFEESAQLAQKWSGTPLYKKPMFWIFAIALLCLLPCLGIILLAFLVVFFVSNNKKVTPYSETASEKGRAYLPDALKNEGRKNKDYYRDIPLGGDIPALYAALTIADITDAESNILGAYLLKWLHKGMVEIKNVKKQGIKGVLGAEAPSIVLLKAPPASEPLESDLYQMLSRASGDDNILQEKEMYRWSQKNYSTYRIWLMQVEKAGRLSLRRMHCMGYIYMPSAFSLSLIEKEAFTEIGRQEIMNLFGFQNYLEDFTLMQEREPVEVTLWNDYLIIAQLFGRADKVAETFVNLNPSHFKDSCYHYDNYNLSSTFIVLSTVSRASASGMRRGSSAASVSASSGGGGSSSSGGGGGFSGGGSGGGGR